MAAAKKKAGRPSKYQQEFDGQAAKLCRLGATDRDIADFFEVSETTLNNWKLRHPSFLESLKRSKDEADALVEKSLFQRALGYSHPAVKVFMPANALAPVYAPFVEHYPPDATSMIFWLKNRQPDKWRDKREGGEGDGDEAQPVTVTVEVKSGRKRADPE